MDTLKVLFGVSILFLAWVFFFRTGLLYRLNAWVRDHIFNDKLVLFSHKRMAVLLLVLGILALFSGMGDLVQHQKIKPNIAEHLIERAREDFQHQRYKRVGEQLTEVVRSDSKNVEAWELLAVSWWTLGEKQLAFRAAEVVLKLRPNDSFDTYPTMLIIIREGKLR